MAASINPSDVETVVAGAMRPVPPRIPGCNCVGVVEAYRKNRRTT
jgi:NADPH:quinone reductase-like Zn-dependent oxidoreductase